MEQRDRLSRLLHCTACSEDERPIGHVVAAYLDVDSDSPAWVAIRLPSSPSERLAPLARSRLDPRGRLMMAVSRPAVEEAPLAPAGHIDVNGEDLLFRYYAHAITPVSRRALSSRIAGTLLHRSADSAVRLRRVMSSAAPEGVAHPVVP